MYLSRLTQSLSVIVQNASFLCFIVYLVSSYSVIVVERDKDNYTLKTESVQSFLIISFFFVQLLKSLYSYS